MSNTFKKGQIIQKRFGILPSKNKAGHLIKWGCDVSIEGGVIYMLSHGSVVILPSNAFLFMKNGTKQKISFFINDIKVSDSRLINLSVKHKNGEGNE